MLEQGTVFDDEDRTLQDKEDAKEGLDVQSVNAQDLFTVEPTRTWDDDIYGDASTWTPSGCGGSSPLFHSSRDASRRKKSVERIDTLYERTFVILLLCKHTFSYQIQKTFVSS